MPQPIGATFAPFLLALGVMAAPCACSTPPDNATTLLAFGEDTPSNLVTAKGYAYWNAGGSIKRVAVAGGATETVLSGVGNWAAFATDGAVVVVATSAGIERFDLATKARTTLARANGHVYAIVIDHGTAFWSWAASSSPYGGYASGVESTDLATGAVVSFDHSSGDAPAFAVDAQYVYLGHGIERKPRAGGGPSVSLASDENAARIVVDAMHVYWASLASSSGNAGPKPLTVRRVAKSGGPIEVLATGGSWNGSSGNNVMLDFLVATPERLWFGDSFGVFYVPTASSGTPIRWLSSYGDFDELAIWDETPLVLDLDRGQILVGPRP